MTDTAVVEAPAPIGAVKDKPGVTLVTMDNFNQYVDQELGTPAAVEGTDADNDPEADAAKEAEALETQRKAALKAEADAENAPREGDIDGSNVFFRGKWVDKHNFNYRVHLKTLEAEKIAAEKVAKAEADAKVSRETAEKAAKEAADLKAKYEPPKPTTLGPKPVRGQYATDADFEAAIIDWAVTDARQKDAKAQAEATAKAENERVVKAWTDRLDAFKAQTPEFDAKLAASSVTASQELQAAIIESEAGPQIFYHLIENPDVAEKIGKMTIPQMLKAVGRLEVELGGLIGGAEKPQTKSAAVGAIAAKPKVAEISKTQAPINPLKVTNSLPVVSSASIAAIADPTARHEAFRAARKAGKYGK